MASTVLDPSKTTLGDLVMEALRESGVIGRGMRARAEDTETAWARMQWILEDWNRKRWMIYAVEHMLAPANGKAWYTVGAGVGGPADFYMGAGDFNDDFNADFGGEGQQNRPAQIEGAFFRQPQSSANTPIDYPLEQIDSGTDYWTRVRLKNLSSWPQFFYYEAAWPQAKLYVYPVIPNNSGYSLGIVVRRPLKSQWAALNTVISFPPEYHQALVYSTAMAIRSTYQFPSFPGDNLPMMEQRALAVIRKGNTRIGRLVVPGELVGRGGRYNIYNDRTD